MPTLSYRRLIPETPPFANYADLNASHPWTDQPRWPCSWIRLEDAPSPPFVVAYRLKFRLDSARRFTVHISGDERYEFFVDGERIGRGPSRAPRGGWHYESYELNLPEGEHTFAARVHSLGKLAPWAQTSYGHGWLLAPEPEDLWDEIGTGRADWEAKVLSGYTFQSAGKQLSKEMGCGPVVHIEGDEHDWDWLNDNDEWSSVKNLYTGNNGVTLYFKEDEPLLSPAPIPPMKAEPYFHARLRDILIQDAAHDFPFEFGEQWSDDDVKRWTGLLKGESVLVEPNRKVRVLLDFEDYLLAYPLLTLSGGQGAIVRLGWSESLLDENNQKKNRSLVAGRHWKGLYDSFSPDGGDSRPFEPLWWRCGRYLLLEVETSGQALHLESLSLEKTGYPLSVVAQWECSNPQWQSLFTLCQRSLEACMHETYMDCPYYEQLQYIGDTRLQILLTYALSGDDRLARQALTAFALAQRNPTGRMPSNHPSGIGQSIPPFTLWWISMLHDFAMWRGDKTFVKSLLPTARQVLGTWLDNLSDEGLIASPEGWNFIDWVDHLGNAQEKFHGVLNWHVVYTLRQLGELEAWCDEPELAARMKRLTESIAVACNRFWDSQRGLYADNLDLTLFSEHANSLAILSGLAPPEHQSRLRESLFEAGDLTRCSVYFSHYLFEAATALGRTNIIEKRLAPWLDLESQGFVTTPETFGESRSDCHAWGAHPLYHYFASFLGICPTSWGFESVEIAPQLGSLPWAKGKISHPNGEIEVNVQRQSDGLHGTVILPEGVGGTFRYGDSRLPIAPGRNEL